jgi:uncharacterized protein (TIGR02391 family)
MENKRTPVLNAQIIESLSRLLANELTGSNIGDLLCTAQLDDIDTNNSKWKRLRAAFINYQNIKHTSNNILAFIQQTLAPVRHIHNEENFQNLRSEINILLSFVGLELTNECKYKLVDRAKTINEAEERANNLKNKLKNTNVHDKIFEYCRAELLVNNYFHAVFEATKSIADRLRKITGLYVDGNNLVELAFATNNVLVHINNFTNETDRSEHIGLCNLIKGIFGIIRNPTAHEPKIKFVITEEEAIDILIMISFIHKRLDKSW